MFNAARTQPGFPGEGVLRCPQPLLADVPGRPGSLWRRRDRWVPGVPIDASRRLRCVQSMKTTMPAMLKAGLRSRTR